jgi:hypothetical protein
MFVCVFMCIERTCQYGWADPHQTWHTIGGGGGGEEGRDAICNCGVDMGEKREEGEKKKVNGN